MKPDGYILAGGKSSRMGTDKGHVKIGDQTFAQKLIHTLQPVCKNLHFVGAPSSYDGYSIPILPDAAIGDGPVAGILAALQDCTTDYAFIVPIDVPLITAAVLQELAVHLEEEPDILYATQQNRHTAVGLYHKKITAQVATYLEGNNNSLHGLLSATNSRAVEMKDPTVLQNFNTPEDLHRIKP